MLPKSSHHQSGSGSGQLPALRWGTIAVKMDTISLGVSY